MKEAPTAEKDFQSLVREGARAIRNDKDEGERILEALKNAHPYAMTFVRTLVALSALPEVTIDVTHFKGTRDENSNTETYSKTGMETGKDFFWVQVRLGDMSEQKNEKRSSAIQVHRGREERFDTTDTGEERAEIVFLFSDDYAEIFSKVKKALHPEEQQTLVFPVKIAQTPEALLPALQEWMTHDLVGISLPAPVTPKTVNGAGKRTPPTA